MAIPRIEELRGRLEKDPGSRLFAQLAEELRKDGALADAIRVCRDGLARHPTYTSARLTLGRCLLEAREAAAAVSELGTVVASAPDNILAVRLLAEAHEAAGNLAAARASYEAALRLAPGDKQVASRLESLASKPSPPAVPAPSAVVAKDPFAPIALVDMGPLDVFEIEGAGGIPLGGPPPPAAEPRPEVDPDAAPETLRVKRPSAAAIEAAGPFAGFEQSPAEPAGVPDAAPLPEPEVGPAAPLASVTLVELYRSQGAIEKAVDTCTEVLRRDPLNAKARVLRDELLAQARQAAAERGPGDRRAALEGAIARLESFLAVVKRG